MYILSELIVSLQSAVGHGYQYIANNSQPIIYLIICKSPTNSIIVCVLENVQMLIHSLHNCICIIY